MKTILTSVLLCCAIISQATVWRVNNNENYIQGPGGPCGEQDVCQHCFSDLQEAIDCSSVQFGDTIYVEASGNSYGPVIIDKQLTIIGTGYLLEDNPGFHCNNQVSMVDYITFSDGSSGSKIQGFALPFGGGSNGSVYLNGSNLSNITIDRCQISYSVVFSGQQIFTNTVIQRNNIGGSVYESSSSWQDLYNLRIENNFIGGYVNFGDVNANGIIEYNTILGNVDINSGLEFMNNVCANSDIDFEENSNSAINVHHNVFASAIPAAINSASNPDELGQSYLLPDLDNPDDLESGFVTSSGCSECNAGSTSGELLGMFGGIQPYIRAGIPPIPSIFMKSNTTAVQQEGTIQIVTSARVNN